MAYKGPMYNKKKSNTYEGPAKRVGLKKKIGFSTLNDDLKSMNETVNGIYGGWQTAETMANTRASVQSMYDRLSAYQDYQKTEGGDDLSDLLNAYKSTLDNWDDRTALYGNYANADAFNKAVKQYQLGEQFKGLSYNDVQARLRRYDSSSDEYNYLKNYTGYTSLQDFDKAIEMRERTIKPVKQKAIAYESDISTLQGQAQNVIKRSHGAVSKDFVFDRVAGKQKEYEEYLKSQGYADKDAFDKAYDGLEELKKAKNLYVQDNGNYDEYKHNTENEDFEELSKYKPVGLTLDNFWDVSKGDKLSAYVNDEDGARDTINSLTSRSGLTSVYQEKGYGQLNDKEKAMFNYLYEQDKVNGTNTAEEFLKGMETALQKRLSNDRNTNREAMLENPFMAGTFSVTSPIIAAAGGMGNIIASGIDILGGQEYNPYEPLREISNANAHGREVVAGNIAEATEGFEIFGQNIPSFLYQTGESVLDTAVGGGAFGGSYTVLMGANAYQDKAKELYERGFDNATIQANALVAGGLEVVFEKIGFDNLVKLKDADSIGAIFKNALKSQGVTELLEEVGTAGGNIIADMVFQGKDSQYISMYNDLIERGYDKKYASGKVALAITSEIGWSGIGGYLSGAGLGGATTTMQYGANKRTGADVRMGEQVGNVFDIANNPDIKDAYDTYTRYANKGITAENATNAQVGNLYNTIASEAYSGSAAAIKDIDKSRKAIEKNKFTAEHSPYDSQVKRATTKLDEAVSTYNEALAREGKYENVIEKIGNVDTAISKAYGQKIEEKVVEYEKAKKDAISVIEPKLKEVGESGDISSVASIIARKSLGEKISKEEALTIKNSEAAQKVLSDIEKSGEVKKLKEYYHNENVKKLSAGVEESVVNETGKSIDIKGIKFGKDNGISAVITSEGEISIDGLSLSDHDASLLDYAHGLATEEEANLFLETYDKDTNKDVDAYANDFELVSAYSNGSFSQDYILNHKGSLSAEQASAIYGKMVIAKAQKAEEEHDKLIASTANVVSYKGYIDDSIIDYNNTSAEGKVNWSSLNSRKQNAVVFLKDFATKLGMNLVFDPYSDKTNGSFSIKDNTIHVSLNAGIEAHIGKLQDTFIPTASHEITHWMKGKANALYLKLKDKVLDSLSEIEGNSQEDIIAEELANLNARHPEAEHTEEDAVDEIIARACEDMLSLSKEGRKLFDSMTESEKKTFCQKVKEVIENLMKWIDDFLSSYKSESNEAETLRKCKEKLEEVSKIWDEMLIRSVEVNQALEKAEVFEHEFSNVGIQFDADSKSVAPTMQFSEKTWTASEYVQNREVAINAIVKAIGVSKEDAERYINNINSIARMIADDRVRLDYESNMDDTATVLKSNSEYKWTLDMSTLCAKRLITTGTFDAIQKALPNSVFNSEDIVNLREMMLKRGYEVACGICYVESTRRELGPITEEFINRYKEAQKTGKPIQRINSEGKFVDLKKTKDQLKTTADKSTEYFYADSEYTPTLAELNTTDIDLVKRDHPLVYEAYLNFMNARGQAKPKLLETRAEYKGDILKHFNKSAVASRNAAGGLRVQSFSDFEVAHLIDMMQAVLDMSRVGLKSQAYTKVPAFADVFGGTGMKINLSLIAKDSGLDKNGNLIFDDIEGINHKEAFRLREKYSKNVGTILVGKNNAHIIAAMADPKIDFIIPFHKSSWKESLYDSLGLTGYEDYTETQNEKPIDSERKIKNFQPSEYWDYSKSGDENAQIYLKKCQEDGRIPKFPQFQGYPGYWKLLIDFKMYDNDGVGSPQTEVKPEFDMKSAVDILNDYEGGHRTFPVAKDVVDDFVAEYKAKNKEKYGDKVQFSDKGNGANNSYYDYAKNDFAKQIDDYLNPNPKLRKKPPYDSFLIGGTPKVLLDIGFNALPVTINKTHIDYAINGTKDFDHEIFIDVLKKLPDALEHPVMVMESDTVKGRAVIIGKITAKNGKKLYLPVEIDGKGKVNDIEIDSNAIASAFGKGNVEEKIENALKREAQGNTSVFYWNKKEAISLLHRGGLQLPTSLPQDGFVHSIREKGSNVNVKMENVTQSLQFVRWFGDWQNNPKKASKVVNRDGTPKIVYHGTDNDFDIFLPGKAGGIYFAGDRNVAEKFTRTGKVEEAYLDIKKPFVVDALVVSEFAGMTFYKQSFYYEIPTPKEMRNAGYRSDTVSTEEIVVYAKKSGKYDGVIIENVRESDGADTTDYIAFSSTQVKSATDNIGLFDERNPNKRYSDKGSTSTYEMMGETKRLMEENEHFKADIDRLNERLKIEKQVTNGKVFNENSLGAVARHIRKIANSNYDTVKLMREIKDVYSYIVESPQVYWEDLYSKCYEVATGVLAESKPEVAIDESYKRILKDFKETRIYLDEHQKAEAKYLFGNNWNRAFFGKVTIANDAKTSLDQQWQEWAELYPDWFDADISPNDQVSKLIDVIDKMRNASEIVMEYDAQEQARSLALEIYNQYWNVSTIKTTADKYQKKLHELRAAHRQMMDKQRDSYKERMKNKLETQRTLDAMYYGRMMLDEKNKELARQKLADDKYYGKLIHRLEVEKEKQADRLKAQGKERLDSYKERAEMKVRIQRITGVARDLNDKLSTNSKDKHVPETMKGIVRDILSVIDFSSKRLLKKGIPTKQDIAIDRVFRHIKDMVDDKNAEAGSLIDDLRGSGIDDKVLDLIKKAELALQEGRVYTLNEMSVQELQEFEDVVRSLRTAVNKVNEFHVAKYNAGIKALGVQSMTEMDKRKKAFKDDKKHYEKLKSKVVWNNLNPYYAFKWMGEKAQVIFSAIQDGQDKLAFLAQEIIEFKEKTYTAKEYNEWKDTFVEFEITENGKKRAFKMNIPQIMSLYCTTKQEDARKHILHGSENEEAKGQGKGITIVETNKTDAVRRNIQLTDADLKMITDTLNNTAKYGRAKEVADKLQEFMSTRGAELGNEISMARWGIKSFTNKNYFPIKVSDGAVPKNNETPGIDSTSMLELLNMSFTKSRNHFAKQSVEIGDIMDVFANHMSNMIRYNAFALPILDMYKWMNCRAVDNLNNEISIATSVKDTFGDHAWSYLNTFLKDVSSATRADTRDNLMVGFFKNAKVAKVAANIRVAALQLTAYVRAGAVMDNKYLLKALTHMPQIKMAKEKCGMALWKSLGYFDTDITRGLSDQIKHVKSVKDKVVDTSLKLAEWGDTHTWGYLFTACELEIQDKRKDLKVGSDEYYQAVNERMREVIYATQVVDSVGTRSQMMRSKSMWDKMLTTFASESTLSLNLAMDTFVSYQYDKRSMGKKAAWEKNGKYIRKAITAYIATNAVTAMVEALFDAFRDYDEEDKDEEYWMKLMLENFALNSSVFNKIPGLNQAVSVVQGYTPSRVDTEWMTDAFKAYTQIGKLINGEGDVEKLLKYGLKFGSDLTGIAGYNFYRDTRALIELFTD